MTLLAKTSFKLVLLSFLFTACFGGGTGFTYTSGTGGSSAAPVAEIEAFENIEISAPDAQGYVTIVGTSSSDVPDNAIVVVTVGDSVSLNIDYKKLLEGLVGTAYASSSCSSDLPTCPELSSGNQCQVVANADGSFQTRVQAGTSNSVAVSYLDPTSCEEQSLGRENVVETSFLTIDVDAVDYLVVDDYFYFGGRAAMDAPTRVLGYDPITKESQLVYTLAVGQDISSLATFKNIFDQKFLVISHDEGTIIVEIESNGVLSSTNRIELYDPIDQNSNVPLSNIRFLMAENMNSAQLSGYNQGQQGIYDETCGSAISYLSNNATTEYMTRVFLVNDTTNKLYVFEFDQDLNNVDTTNPSAYGNPIYKETDLIKPRVFTFAFDNIANDLPNFDQTLEPAQIKLEQLYVDSNTLYTALISYPTSTSGRQVFVIGITSNSDRSHDNFCGTYNLQTDGSFTFSFQMLDTTNSGYGSVGIDLGISAVSILSRQYKEGEYWAIVKPTYGAFTLFDAKEIQCYFNQEINLAYLSTAGTESTCAEDGNNKGAVFNPVSSNMAEISAFDSFFGILQFNNDDRTLSSIDLTFFGSENNNAVNYSPIDNFYYWQQDTTLFAIEPLGVWFDAENQHLYLIDRGLENDGKTLIRPIDVDN